MARAHSLLEVAAETRLFLIFAMRRFGHDRCPEAAASLAFTSLLALVPVMTIGLALFAIFPVFDAMQAELQRFVFDNFLPHAGREIEQYLNTFTRNTGQLTALGMIVIALTAVLLLATVERTFGRIWRATGRRAVLVRFLVYWALITLGPVFFGVSLSVSSYLFAAARSVGVESLTGPLSPLAALVPPALAFLGFAILYLVIAYRPVHWRHAAVGAGIATILFELLKKLFGIYVISFPTYQTIYGALSVLPIFLVWIYVCWIIAPFGAEIAAALPEWDNQRRDGKDPLSASRRLDLALDLLAALFAAHAHGGGLKRRTLLAAMAARPDQVSAMLAMLEQRRYVAAAGRDRYLLARDLAQATLYDLCRDLDLGLARGEDHGEAQTEARGEAGWRADTAAILDQVDAVTRQAMGRTLAELLGPRGAARDDEPGGDRLRLAHPKQPS